jgi:hypothetical protein
MYYSTTSLRQEKTNDDSSMGKRNEGMKLERGEEERGKEERGGRKEREREGRGGGCV